MRALLITVALLLAACSQEEAGETRLSHPYEFPELEAQPSARDAGALSASPQPGAWTFRVDEGTHAAGFGPPESEYLLTIVCEAPSGKLTLTSSHELSPDQDTTLRIITAVQTLDLPARSFNEGLPSVNAEVLDDAPAKIPLISMLGAPTDRFAIEVGGEAMVFPWDESIAQALTACR